MRTLVYTCADKEYSHWIPLYCLGLLLHNKDIDIEIGIEGTLDDGERECVEYLKNRFSDAQIIIHENWFDVTDDKHVVFDGKKIILNTVRFLIPPTIKDEYIYIGDIDIICLEDNIFDGHIKEMTEHGRKYSNIVRKTDDRRMSGLHFSEYDAYYPIEYTSDMNISGNDEVILKNLVEKKNEIDYDTTYRPIHGIHFSKNRPTVAGADGIPGWGADAYRNEWREFASTEEYGFMFDKLNDYQKNQIKKLENHYISTQ